MPAIVTPHTVPTMAQYVLRVKPPIKIKLTIVITDTRKIETGTGASPANKAGIKTVTISTQVNTRAKEDLSPCARPRISSAAKNSPAKT